MPDTTTVRNGRSAGYPAIDLMASVAEDFVRAVFTRVVELATGKKWPRRERAPVSVGEYILPSPEELDQMSHEDRKEFEKRAAPFFVGFHQRAIDVLCRGKKRKGRGGIARVLQDEATPVLLDLGLKVLKSSSPKDLIPRVRSGMSDYDVKVQMWKLLKALPGWAYDEFLGQDLKDVYHSEDLPDSARVACPFSAELGGTLGDAISPETLAQMTEMAAPLPSVSVEKETATAAQAGTRYLRELDQDRRTVPQSPEELAAVMNQAGAAHKAGWRLGSLVIPRVFPVILACAGALVWFFLF